MILLTDQLRAAQQVSGGPGDDPNGGLSGPPDVLVRLCSLAPPLQQVELLQQEASAFWSFSQGGQSPQGVDDEGLPLLLFLLLSHQVQENRYDTEIQTLLLPCRRKSHRPSGSECPRVQSGDQRRALRPELCRIKLMDVN